MQKSSRRFAGCCGVELWIRTSVDGCGLLVRVSMKYTCTIAHAFMPAWAGCLSLVGDTTGMPAGGSLRTRTITCKNLWYVRPYRLSVTQPAAQRITHGWLPGCPVAPVSQPGWPPLLSTGMFHATAPVPYALCLCAPKDNLYIQQTFVRHMTQPLCASEREKSNHSDPLFHGSHSRTATSFSKRKIRLHSLNKRWQTP